MVHYLNDASASLNVREKMLFNWKSFFILLISCLLVIQLQAQTNYVTIKGNVVDEKGEAIIGANITVKGNSIGTITDVDGNFQLKAIPGSILKISYIGYSVKEVKAEAKGMKIQLVEDSKALGEVVVVGYGEQKKVSVVGSISTASGRDINKSPSGSLGTAMVGRLNGLVSVQETGIPGGETPRINIRGVSTLNDASPLVIVDGIERTGGGRANGDPKDISGGTMGNVSGWEAINPNDVESISVLKDASATAVYGVKGANGVIIITTKRGQSGKPVVSYTFNYGLSQPTSLKQPLNSYETIMYANEANNNDGKLSIKSYDEMNNYRYHVNDYLYPDLNINDYMLRNNAPKVSHNFNISGGSDLVRYFCSVGYYDETGLLKDNAAYGFNANNKYSRTNIRSNLDFQFTKRFSASINIDARYEDRQGARNPGNNIFWTQMYMSVPWISPGFDKDNHMVISNLPASANGYPLFVAVQSGGLYKREQITANTLFSTKYDLDQITKGLSIAGKFSFDSYTESWFNTMQAHARVDITRDPLTNGPIAIKSGFDGEMLITRQNPDKRKKYYFETSLNYARTFGDHNVTALALYNQEKRHYFESSFPDVPVAYLGFVSRITYNYKSRYFAEFNLGINGSENFPVGQRFGTFPAYSVGWLLSDEPFMKAVKFISSFKFRASYGEVGSDRIGNNRFLYIPGNYVYFPNQYVGIFGEQNNVYGGANGIPAIQEGSAANKNVTWETAKKTNLGFDSKFINDKLSLVVDLFQENRDNILTNMETLPGFLFPNFPYNYGPVPYTKSYTTPVNYAKVQNRGIEIELGWNDKIGKDFNYFAKLTLAYSKNKAILLSESKKDYPWLYNQGLPLQISRGLIAEGYWNSYSEINNPNNPYNTYESKPIPGDIRYKDVNGDMKIDENDKVPLDYSTLTPRTTFAGSFGFSYKGFDMSLLLQGATGMIYMPSGFSQRLGQGGDKAVFDWIKDRWTPQNRDANYPVLHSMSQLTETSSNYIPSTFWAYDDTYIRIKNIQIGYVIPKSFTSKLAISNLRLSLTAQNLLTWTLDDRMKNYDPEAWSGGGGLESYYPIMKMFNFGVDVTF